MNNQEINLLLKELGIEQDISNVSVRDVNVAFRKLAKVMHPDKAGGEKTAQFQELLATYNKLKEYFKEKNNLKDEDIFENDYEERFFRDIFERFNFPSANKGSFTIGIEDYMADTWQECLKQLLGEPKLKINDWGTECDRSWKTLYMGIELTIHIYNKPKNKKGSKIMIQGKLQSLLCSYVFDELPRIYKTVCENRPKKIETNKKKSTPSKPGVQCEQCKFTSSLIQMKMHIKTVHRTKPNRMMKRLSNFTPRMEQKKKKKQDKSISMNIVMNSEGVMEDDSIMVYVDTFSGKEGPQIKPAKSDTIISNEEVTLEESAEVIELKDELSCSKCDFKTTVKDELVDHISSHKEKDMIHAGAVEAPIPTQAGAVISNEAGEAVSPKADDVVSAEAEVAVSTILEAEVSTENADAVSIGTVDAAPAGVGAELPTEVPVVQSQSGNFYCTKCVKSFEDENLLDEHVDSMHSGENTDGTNVKQVSEDAIPQHVVICGECGKGVVNILEYNDHKKVHIKKVTNNCHICGQSFKAMTDVETHIATEHVDVGVIKCSPCQFSTKSQAEFDIHTAAKHTFTCDQCQVKFYTMDLLSVHRSSVHTIDMVECPYCDYKAPSVQRMKDHIEVDHAQFAFLGHITEKQSSLNVKFDKFKEDITNILKTIVEDHNAIKQELFIRRQSNNDDSQRIERIEKSVNLLTQMVLDSTTKNNSKTQSEGSSDNSTTASSKQSSELFSACIVGDSISANMDTKVIANVLKKEVRSVRAYSTLNDTCETETMEKL